MLNPSLSVILKGDISLYIYRYWGSEESASYTIGNRIYCVLWFLKLDYFVSENRKSSFKIENWDSSRYNWEIQQVYKWKELVGEEKASNLPHCQRMQSDKPGKQAQQRHVLLGVMEAWAQGGKGQRQRHTVDKIKRKETRSSLGHTKSRVVQRGYYVQHQVVWKITQPLC